MTGDRKLVSTMTQTGEETPKPGKCPRPFRVSAEAGHGFSLKELFSDTIRLNTSRPGAVYFGSTLK